MLILITKHRDELPLKIGPVIHHMQLHVIYVENYPGLPWWISPLAHLFWGGFFLGGTVHLRLGYSSMTESLERERVLSP